MKRPFERHRGFRTPSGIAESGSDGTASLVASLELARRAGRIVAPILKPFGMSVDFTEGHARVEDGTLVLLAQNAVQANRIRNLERRLTRALAAEGLPIFAVACRVLPAHAPAEPADNGPKGPVRHASMSGAQALRAGLGDVRDPKLRETLARLADVISPRPEEVPPESARLLEALRLRLMTGTLAVTSSTAMLPPAPDPALIPSAGAAAADPGLAGVRHRMSARLEARRALDERLEKLKTRAARLGASIEALAERAEAAADPQAFWACEAPKLESLRRAAASWTEAVDQVCSEIRAARAATAARTAPPPIRMAAPPEEMRRERAAEARWAAELEETIREARRAVVAADAEARAAQEAEDA